MENKKTRLQSLKEEQFKIREEIKEKTIGYILAAFSFIAGLAWNEAIKSFIDQFSPHASNSVLIKFVYAVLVTFIVVIVTVYIIKLNEKK